jgi:hypothetical protein
MEEEVAAAVEAAGARLQADEKPAAGPVAVAAAAQPTAVARAEGGAGSWRAGWVVVQRAPAAGWASPGLRWAGRAGWPRCAAEEAGPALRRRWRSPHARRPPLHRAYLKQKNICENKKLEGNMS